MQLLDGAPRGLHRWWTQSAEQQLTQSSSAFSEQLPDMHPAGWQRSTLTSWLLTAPGMHAAFLTQPITSVLEPGMLSLHASRVSSGQSPLLRAAKTRRGSRTAAAAFPTTAPHPLCPGCGVDRPHASGPADRHRPVLTTEASPGLRWPCCGGGGVLDCSLLQVVAGLEPPAGLVLGPPTQLCCVRHV